MGSPKINNPSKNGLNPFLLPRYHLKDGADLAAVMSRASLDDDDAGRNYSSLLALRANP